MVGCEWCEATLWQRDSDQREIARGRTMEAWQDTQRAICAGCDCVAQLHEALEGSCHHWLGHGAIDVLAGAALHLCERFANAGRSVAFCGPPRTQIKGNL